MKAADVTQHSLDVPKAALAAENAILGTWKLQSLVYEVSATGQRFNPFGDHPDGYLSYSPDGRMYAIGVVEDRPKPRDLVSTDEDKVELQGKHIGDNIAPDDRAQCEIRIFAQVEDSDRIHISGGGRNFQSELADTEKLRGLTQKKRHTELHRRRYLSRLKMRVGHRN